MGIRVGYRTSERTFVSSGLGTVVGVFGVVAVLAFGAVVLLAALAALLAVVVALVFAIRSTTRRRRRRSCYGETRYFVARTMCNPPRDTPAHYRAYLPASAHGHGFFPSRGQLYHRHWLPL